MTKTAADQTEDPAPAPPPAPPPEVSEDGPDEALLAPIPGDDPCGANLRYEGTFDTIREARKDEDPNLPQGVWETDIKRADWALVATTCETALAQKSKDLHLALWLTEAWTHREGLRGFRRGIDLTSSLCEEYWEILHPKIDDDGDLDFRLGPLRWAAESFPILLRLVAISAPTGGDANPMRLKDWEDVLRLENLQQRNAAAAKREQARYPTRAEFEASIELTPIEHFLDLVPVAEACLGEIERLDLIMEEHCPKDAPSLMRIREVLQDIDTRARIWVTQKGGVLPNEDDADAQDGIEDDAITDGEAADPASTDESPGTGAEEGAKMSGKAQPAGPIQSRAEAYKRLSEAADYLVRTEPHSPVPYLVKRAVDWGNMSFGELLVELVEGGGDHQRVLRLLGLDNVGKKKS